MAEFADKFIAFVDILGFKQMVISAENGTGSTLAEIEELLSALQNQQAVDFFRTHGAQTCPESVQISKDMSFQATQISDCVIASAEVSPAGVINLVSFCWQVAFSLLRRGVLVRGYLTRGSIFHEGNRFIGSGYQSAFARESDVSFFKGEADERGTPFIEIDASVVNYVQSEGDSCTHTMFDRLAKNDGDVWAIFPFQKLQHSFMIGGYGAPPFDPTEERRRNDVVRSNMKLLRSRVSDTKPSSESAARKIRHYVRALDDQLAVCDRTDQAIDSLTQPYPKPTRVWRGSEKD